MARPAALPESTSCHSSQPTRGKPWTSSPRVPLTRELWRSRPEVDDHAVCGHHHPLPLKLVAAALVPCLVARAYRPRGVRLQEVGPVLVLRAWLRRLDRHHVADCARCHELLRRRERGVGGRNCPAAQGNVCPGAGPDHPVGLLQRVDHGLLGNDALRPVLDGGDGQVHAAPDVGGDRNEVGLDLFQHRHRVGVDALGAVPRGERIEAAHVPVGGGDELDVGPVGHGLGVARRPSRPEMGLVLLEPAMDVQVGGRPVTRQQVEPGLVERGPGARRQVVQHPHPSEPYHCAAVLGHCSPPGIPRPAVTGTNGREALHTRHSRAEPASEESGAGIHPRPLHCAHRRHTAVRPHPEPLDSGSRPE